MSKLTAQGVRDLNSYTMKPRRVVINPCAVGLHAPGPRRDVFNGYFENVLCLRCGEVIDTVERKWG